MDTEETKRRPTGAGATALAIIPFALVFVFGLLVLFVIAASSGAGGYASIGEGVALLAALFASPICFGMLALPSSGQDSAERSPARLRSGGYRLRDTVHHRHLPPGELELLVRMFDWLT